MNIYPELLEKIQARTSDVDQFINDLLFTYFNEGFIRKSDVIGLFVTDKMFRKNVHIGDEIYDNVTKEFIGVSVEGKEITESLFIVDDRLVEALESHQVIMVMNSPREKGISEQEANEFYSTNYDKH